MALSNLALYGGAFFTPVIVGIATERIGWEWTFWLVAIFSGILFPFIILYVPETAYRRPAYLNLDTTSKDDLTSTHLTDSRAHSTSDDKIDDGFAEQPTPPKAPFLETLLPFNGRKTDDSFWKILLRPLPLVFHPAIFWAMLTQGTLIGWTVMIGVDIAVLYFRENLNFATATCISANDEYSPARFVHSSKDRIYLRWTIRWWHCWICLRRIHGRLVGKILDSTE